MSNTVNSLDELIALIDEQQAERLILELDITRYSAEYAKALKRLTEAEAMQGRQLALDNAFISSKSEDIDYLRDQVEKLRPQSVKTVYVAFKRLSGLPWTSASTRRSSLLSSNMSMLSPRCSWGFIAPQRLMMITSSLMTIS